MEEPVEKLLAPHGLVWVDDVLPGHQAATIDLDPEDDGALAATLVRNGPPTQAKVVVYVHGYADYYFHTHFSSAWRCAGYDVVAVDLRRCGRSLRADNRANYFGDVTDYWPEVDAAIAEAARDHDQVVLYGHSTGGLIASIYADRGPLRHEVSAVILNSPWFDVKLPWNQALMWKVASWFGHFVAHQELNAGPSFYIESIHSSMRGQWDFNLDWKPEIGVPIQIGWARAVARAHAIVHRGLDIAVPVLVQHSDRSVGNDEWSEDLLRCDSVLDVDQIHYWSPALGPNVSIETVPGAMHDLWLSAPEVRAEVATRTFGWLGRSPRSP